MTASDPARTRAGRHGHPSSSTTWGRLAVKLVPDAESEVVVSQERAVAFRSWVAG